MVVFFCDCDRMIAGSPCDGVPMKQLDSVVHKDLINMFIDEYMYMQNHPA